MIPASHSAQTILQTAIQQAHAAHARRVTHVRLVLGEMADQTDDEIRSDWEAISKGTLAEGAQLLFRRVPAEVQYMNCFSKYRPVNGAIRCPNCGSVGAKILAGEELFMEAVDLE